MKNVSIRIKKLLFGYYNLPVKFANILAATVNFLFITGASFVLFYGGNAKNHKLSLYFP